MKSEYELTQKMIEKSPSSRGRGLKYHVKSGLNIRKLVALFTRAWIEIVTDIYDRLGVLSPSSRGRGLKSDNPYVN